MSPGSQEAKAAVLARYLASGAQLEEQSTLEGVDVLLVTGADFTTVLHDNFYGFRADRLEVIWPILGRGKLQ